MFLSSLVSPLISVLHSVFPFNFLCFLHFLFNFHFPFLGFTFLLCLLLPIIICINPFPSFLPSLFSTLFATKDDASDKTDGKIISLCFKSYNILVLFFFLCLLFPHFIPVHHSMSTLSCSVRPQCPLLSALCSTLICVTMLLRTSFIKLITHLKFMFYFTTVLFLIWKWSNYLQLH